MPDPNDALVVASIEVSGSGQVLNQPIFTPTADGAFLVLSQLTGFTNAGLEIAWTDPEGNGGMGVGSDSLSLVPARIKANTTIAYQVSGTAPIGNWTLHIRLISLNQ